MVQVRPLVLSLFPYSLQGVAHRASAPSRSQKTMHRPPPLPALQSLFPVPWLGLCPLHPLPNHDQELCPLLSHPWPLLPLARTACHLPLPARARSPGQDSGVQCRALQPAGLARSPSLGRQERVQSVRTLTRSRPALEAKPTDTPRTARKPTA